MSSKKISYHSLLTGEQVAKGNKVFGAAVLDTSFRVITAGTNEETTCPLFHGEVKVISCQFGLVYSSAMRSIFVMTLQPR
jgi:tRNA(Arg) A34 adenosine deaminase TadA